MKANFYLDYTEKRLLQRLVRPDRCRRRHTGKTAKLTATADRADQVPQLPIFCVVLVKMGLHTKNQPDLSINVPRADFLGFLVPTSAPNLS